MKMKRYKFLKWNKEKFMNINNIISLSGFNTKRCPEHTGTSNLSLESGPPTFQIITQGSCIQTLKSSILITFQEKN